MDSFELDLILKEDDFSMIYRGEFNDEMTYELMELLNSGINDKKWVRKRLSYLVAECFQNVIRHADTENSDKPDPILITRKKKGNHFITSINLVENSEIEKNEIENKYLNLKEEYSKIKMKLEQVSQKKIEEFLWSAQRFS